MLTASSAWMSGTTGAPERGLLHPVAVPAAMDATAPVPWPLHFMLVLERIVQPDKATFGAPLKVSDSSESGCPVSRVRMQELSGWSAAEALALAAMAIWSKPEMPTKVVCTETVAVPV